MLLACCQAHVIDSALNLLLCTCSYWYTSPVDLPWLLPGNQAHHLEFQHAMNNFKIIMP